jgi:hypothetical protein
MRGVLILLFVLFLFALALFGFRHEKSIKECYYNCNGCLDEKSKCHPGTVSVCSNESKTICYAFYDEKGLLRDPCGIKDKFGDVEKSCNNCQKYCNYCIGIDGIGRCVSRSLFNCERCPGNKICKDNINAVYY